jgi:NitT/TauT family transport system substrate-binding protein
MSFGCLRNEVKDKDQTAESESSLSGDVTEKALRKVSFLPYWVTTAQFAGYYVAKEKGIYQKYGIDLTIIPYKPFITSSELISKGEADFAALWLVNAIELKAKGVDIVNIAQVSSRSSAMLITKKSSGIKTIEDMDGKRAGIWSGYELQPKALFSKYNIDVTIIPIGNTNTLFLLDGVEIINANWFDEYHSIINSGYDPDDLNLFFFADYGFNFLEDGIYCLSDKLDRDPRLCEDFVRATLEGWKYAFSHPEEAVSIVMEYTKKEKLPVNKVHQSWILGRYKDLYLQEGKDDFNNILPEKDYIFVADVLKKNKLIDEIPEYDKFYKPIIKNR